MFLEVLRRAFSTSRMEPIALTYAIEYAVRDLREGNAPTLHSWKRIYREVCEQFLTMDHVCDHEINNLSRSEALSVAGLAKIIVPIPSRDTVEQQIEKYTKREPDNTCGMKSLSAYVKALKSNLKKAKRMNLTTQADLYSPRSRIFRDAVILFALREIRGFWTQDYKVLILNITFKGHPPKKPSFDDLLEYEKAMNIAACRAFLQAYEMIDEHCSTCNGNGWKNKDLHPVYCLIRVVRCGDNARFPVNTDPLITYILGMVTSTKKAAMSHTNVGKRAMTGRSKFLRLVYELDSDSEESTDHRPDPIMEEIGDLGQVFTRDLYDFDEGHFAVQVAFRISTCARVIAPQRLKPMTTSTAPK